MRKILLTLLIASVACACAFAFWNPFSRTTMPTLNEAELRATLASLAPTEAEAKAIAVLRAKSFSQQQAQQSQELETAMQKLQMQADWFAERLAEKFPEKTNAPPPDHLQQAMSMVQYQMNVLKTAITNVEPPVEAEPVDNDSIQIAVEYRLFSGSESFTGTIIGHPAMEWSALPVATPFLSTGTPPGTISRSVSTQMPLHVRYLEHSNVERFYDLFSSHRAATIMTSPKLMLSNGQEGAMDDTTSIPFVTGILPVELENETVYQPIIQLLGQGQTYTTKVTLLQDGSYRLTSQMEFTTATKAERYRLIDRPPTPQELAEDSRSQGGITFQVPTIHTFRVNIPDVVIPDGMSLLVAFPGNVDPKSNDYNPQGGIFMLITPQKVEAIEFASEDVQQVPDEWERFWIGDVPLSMMR